MIELSRFKTADQQDECTNQFKRIPDDDSVVFFPHRVGGALLYRGLAEKPVQHIKSDMKRCAQQNKNTTIEFTGIE